MLVGKAVGAPHQRETGVTMEKVVIGLDMAKAKFDISVQGQASKFSNAAAGHRRFVKLARRYRRVHVVMEATGNYHLHLVKRLSEAGISFSVINPLQLKRFAQMKLRRIKTDASDALLLAQYGCDQKPGPSRLEPAVRQQLKQINTHLDQLTKQRTSLKNLMHANSYLPHSMRECEQILSKLVGQIDRSIKRLESKQVALVDRSYAQTKERVMSISGLGQRTACALLAYVGDLSTFKNHKQLSAYMGLNPVPMESGKMQARSHISKQGNAKLRSLFYLCALSAKRYNKDCKKLYERLLAKGKEKKVALIAVANKLIRQVFAVVKSGVAFDNDYVEKMRLNT